MQVIEKKKTVQKLTLKEKLFLPSSHPPILYKRFSLGPGLEKAPTLLVGHALLSAIKKANFVVVVITL